MCICNNREAHTHLNDNVLLAHECEDGSHLLVYSSQVAINRSSLSTAGSQKQRPGNAILIAIPAVPGTLDANCLVPVGEYPNFMRDYQRALQPPARSSRGMMKGGMSFGIGNAPTVVKGFDGGLWDVVLSPSAGAIASVIDMVDPEKQPELNLALYEQLDFVYGGQVSYALFCFDQKDARRAGCAAVRYQPSNKDRLSIPGLDGHAGYIEPGKVALNHTLVASSYRLDPKVDAADVTFSDSGFASKFPFFPKRVIGKIISPGMPVPNGDFEFKLDDVRAGRLNAYRVVPPNFHQLTGADQSLRRANYVITSDRFR